MNLLNKHQFDPILEQELHETMTGKSLTDHRDAIENHAALSPHVLRPDLVIRQTGFTMVELIAVVVLTVVIAIVVLPRWINVLPYQVEAATSEFVSLAQFAQESALQRTGPIPHHDVIYEYQKFVDDGTTDPPERIQRVQLVFDQATVPPEVRVEGGVVPSNQCGHEIFFPTVLRRLPMIDTLSYADGIVQYNPSGEVQCCLPALCSGRSLQLDFDVSGVADVCVEASGYAHAGACY